MAERAAARKYILIPYTVRGMDRLPYDMLRYDRSVPDTEADAGLAERSGQRDIHLVRFAPVGGYLKPNVERWQSFGWEVVFVGKPRVP